jgi:hypothetical protein
MTELPKLEWPPLITGASVPAWVRVRDVVLTLAAWLLLLWAMRYGLALAVDYLRRPMFEFSRMAPPDWSELGHRLEPFLGFIAALAHGRAMRVTGGPATAPSHPLPVPPCEPVASFGMTAQDVEAWCDARVIVVDLADDGHSFRGDVRQRIGPETE